MKKGILIFSVCLSLLAVRPAQALILDLPDQGGIGLFKDLSTGYTWMDIDNFFGQTYTSIYNSLLSSTFHIATLDEISQLKISAPAELALFDLHASIMGSSASRNLIWGYYDDDGNQANGGSWNFKWGANTINQSTEQWFTSLGTGTNEIASDLGAWVVNTALPNPVIPEPAAGLLFAFGFAAKGISLRRKSRA